MKKQYVAPETEIVEIENVGDILTASTGTHWADGTEKVYIDGVLQPK